MNWTRVGRITRRAPSGTAPKEPQSTRPRRPAGGWKRTIPGAAATSPMDVLDTQVVGRAVIEDCARAAARRISARPA
jgi:hypothetical protein